MGEEREREKKRKGGTTFLVTGMFFIYGLFQSSVDLMGRNDMGRGRSEASGIQEHRHNRRKLKKYISAVSFSPLWPYQLQLVFFEHRHEFVCSCVGSAFQCHCRQ